MQYSWPHSQFTCRYIRMCQVLLVLLSLTTISGLFINIDSAGCFSRAIHSVTQYGSRVSSRKNWQVIEMKMLQLIREMLRLLGVCLECGATRRDFYLSAFVNVLILASFFAIITSSDMYLYENLDEIGEAIFCLMQIVSFVAISGTYVSFMLKKRSIFDFFNEMQEFVDESIRESRALQYFQNLNSIIHVGERLNPANYRFYREAEHRSFSVTKWPILIYLAYVDFMIIGTTIFTVIFEMIPVRSEPTTWYTILRIRWDRPRMHL